MIAEVGEPDEQTENPHCRTATTASLYRIERVESWIDDHRAAVEWLAERRVGGVKRDPEPRETFITNLQASAETVLRPAAEAGTGTRTTWICSKRSRGWPTWCFDAALAVG
jgi:hypothetical protein